MKITRILFPTILVLHFSAALLSAQAPVVMLQNSVTSSAATEQTETFKVLGNCDMCKRTIEKAALDTGASQATWDMDAHLLTITFDPAKISVEAVQKAVAQVGYDNAGFKAPDTVYKRLHACCRYNRKGAPSSTKVCTEGEMPKN